eukprot:4954781-Lingulodinium_polyedra.AAC.1
MEFLSGYKTAARAFGDLAAIYHIPAESIKDMLEVQSQQVGSTPVASSGPSAPSGTTGASERGPRPKRGRST